MTSNLGLEAEELKEPMDSFFNGLAATTKACTNGIEGPMLVTALSRDNEDDGSARGGGSISSSCRGADVVA